TRGPGQRFFPTSGELRLRGTADSSIVSGNGGRLWMARGGWIPPRSPGSCFRKVRCDMMLLLRTRRGAGADLGLRVLGLALIGGAAALASAPAPVPAPAQGQGQIQESWDAVYLAGAKVGYIHTFVEPLKDRGRDLLRVRVDTSLSLKRLEDEITMELRYGTIETPEGAVLRLDTRTVASTQEI